MDGKFEKGNVPWNKNKPHLKEERNPQWKGDEVGYTALHDWLRKNYGNASKCEMCGKTGTGRQINWSKLQDKPYARNRENFWQLCASCHTKYDNKIPKGWNKGRKETRLEVLKKQSLAHIGNRHSKLTRAKMKQAQINRRIRERKGFYE